MIRHTERRKSKRQNGGARGELGRPVVYRAQKPMRWPIPPHFLIEKNVEGLSDASEGHGPYNNERFYVDGDGRERWQITSEFVLSPK